MWDLEKSTSTDAGQDVDPDEKFLSPTATVTASKDTHTHSLTSLHYYPIDAGMFLTTAFDRRLLVWDTSTLEPAFSTTFAHAPTSISISPVGHHTLVAVASPGPEVRLVDLASGSSVRSLGTGGTASVRWSERDGWLLMAGSTEGEVSIWDVRMARGCLGMLGERRGRVTRGHEGKLRCFFKWLLKITLNFFGFLRGSTGPGSPRLPRLPQILVLWVLWISGVTDSPDLGIISNYKFSVSQ